MAIYGQIDDLHILLEYESDQQSCHGSNVGHGRKRGSVVWGVRLTPLCGRGASRTKDLADPHCGLVALAAAPRSIRWTIAPRTTLSLLGLTCNTALAAAVEKFGHRTLERTRDACHSRLSDALEPFRLRLVAPALRTAKGSLHDSSDTVLDTSAEGPAIAALDNPQRRDGERSATPASWTVSYHRRRPFSHDSADVKTPTGDSPN